MGDDGDMKARLLLIQGAILLALTVVAFDSARAQDLETSIRAKLGGKPLYLKGFWSEDELKFDADGRPIEIYKTTSFTLAGFEPTKVKISHNKAKIEGRRIALRFADDHVERVKTDKMTIELALQSGSDPNKALDAIFADGLGELTPSLPEYWQTYAAKHFLPAPTSAVATENVNAIPEGVLRAALSGNSKTRQIGGDVKPPRSFRRSIRSFRQPPRNRDTQATWGSTW
jgi:hypothetical protein